MRFGYNEYRMPQTQRLDPYGGYLHELKQHHPKHCVIITAMGLPAAMGLGHIGPLGRSQGNLTEEEQGRMVKEMLEVILESGFHGAFVFELTDEWFKRSW